MHFRYKGTKNLKVPILGPQLGIPASQADPKMCVARCMKAYLDRTARTGFAHQDRVLHRQAERCLPGSLHPG